MHTRADFELARAQFRERCNATCERTTLPFAVDGLQDLCARNPNIPKVYSKCGAAAAKAADNALPRTLPRPKCHSVGQNVAFIASTAEGGTITCDPETPVTRQQPPAWLNSA